MPSTKGVSTRSRNAIVHPGLVVKGNPRCSSKEVAAERQAKEEAKQKKARTKAAGIKRVAAYEIDQADKHAADATPRAAPKAKPLTRTRSYANILVGSDVEMTDGEVPGGGSNFDLENEDIDMSASNTETESVELPPKKKKKAMANDLEVTVKKADAPKPKLRDAVEKEKMNLARSRVNVDIPDLDPTPNPKRTRPAGPATEFNDWAISDQGKVPSWRMPAFGDNGSLDVEPMDKGKEKEMAVGKGKAKATRIKHDGKANASDKKSDTRVLPKSKR
jgi:hypothetical protein